MNERGQPFNPASIAKMLTAQGKLWRAQQVKNVIERAVAPRVV